ncbi:MAG: AAA family ATPase [Colwellia sp.]
MYTNFFSLSEPPFSIAPNPKYLFMSDRHREALAHLTYGLGGSILGGNGGFVLLTGEVGTGKTTVSRCLMEQLPENTQVAFILNPMLSSQELLATICDQLKIRYRKTGATLKTLTDKISEKLLKNHHNDINTLLIIDEAQHLQPEVLEQLRLLTNLETNTKKLLQVILIGQPELQQLLQRRDLRQLAQRITARYHLLPLNTEELNAYVKHRLSVADCHRALFNKSALATIHKLSQGIPRLINLLCHRALMDAYNGNNAVVNKKIVLNAAAQALGEEYLPKSLWQHASVKLAIAAGTLFVVLVAGFWFGQGQAPEVQVQEVNSELQKEPKIQPQVPNVELQKEPETQSQVPSIELQKGLEVQLQVPSVELKKEAKVQLQVSSAELKKEAEAQLQVQSVDGVSDDLLARFQAAIENESVETAEVNNNVQDTIENQSVKSLTQMPLWVQQGVPSLIFEQHIYATDGEGWVNVNGRDRYEGDQVAENLFIDQILPQQVILTYRGEKFSLPALTNW